MLQTAVHDVNIAVLLKSVVWMTPRETSVKTLEVIALVMTVTVFEVTLLELTPVTIQMIALGMSMATFEAALLETSIGTAIGILSMETSEAVVPNQLVKFAVVKVVGDWLCQRICWKAGLLKRPHFLTYVQVAAA